MNSRLGQVVLLCGLAFTSWAGPMPVQQLFSPKPPAEALAAIHVKDGYEVELVAAEPLVMSPVAIDWGADGRLWVAEMLDYPTGMDGKGKPGGRIKMLEDTHGDGKYDKATVVLDGVQMPTGIATWRDGVLVAAAPEIFFLRENGEKKVLFTGFKEGNPQLRVNALRWGLDGWVYCANGFSGGTIKSLATGKTLKIEGHDVRIRPDDGAMELVSGMSQYGRDCDDYGNWFGCDNSHPLFHFVLEDRYLRRNPDVPGIDPKRQLIVPANGPVNAISPTRNLYDRTLASPGHPGHFTSACGLTIYRDDLLLGREAGVEHAFVCEPVHNLIRHTVLREDGISFAATRPSDEQDREFLASEDPWCRPVFLRTGPDGALWVVDMYRYMIEHPEWLPAGGPQKMAPRFRDGAELGRIYRVYPKGKRPGAAPRLDKLDAAGLAAAIQSPNGWVRDKAQQLILWRNEQAAIPPLLELVRTAKDPVARLQALWTLEGLQALDTRLMELGLKDSDAAIRRQTLRLIESRAADAPELITAAARLVEDPDATVRLQLTCSLGEWNTPEAAAALAHLAAAGGDDPHWTAGVMSSASKHYRALADVLLAANRPVTDPLYRDLLAIALAKNDRTTMEKLLRPILTPRDGVYNGQQVAAFGSFMERRVAHYDHDSDPLPKEHLRVLGLFGTAATIAQDAGAPLASRVAAIDLLGYALHQGTDYVRSYDGVLAKLLSPQSPPEVQVAAVKAIARSALVDAPKLLLAGWPGHSPQTRAAIVDALLAREPFAWYLLDQIEAGAVPAAQIDVPRRQRLLRHESERVRTLAKKLFGGEPNAARQKVVEAHRPALSLAGDPTRGAKVFAQACATCHRLGNVGQEVGPDLRSVSGWESEALLVAILDPNRQVEPRYLGYTVTLSNGDSILGIITGETAGGITLKALDGKEQAIGRSNIKSLDGTNRSLMPDGLEATLGDQDLGDVIRFLQGGGNGK